MELLFFLLSCAGLTFIITMSYIFAPIRNQAEKIHKTLGKLFKCTQCMGFWVGIFVRALMMWNQNLFATIQWSDAYNVCYGFISSFFCYGAYLLLKDLINKHD